MKIRCRGHYGDLTYLTVDKCLRNMHGEFIRIYSITVSVDEKTNVELSYVGESELEILPEETKERY